jgi:hypothetical protein
MTIKESWNDIFGEGMSTRELARIPFLARYLQAAYEELCRDNGPDSGYEIGRYTPDDFRGMAEQIKRDAASQVASRGYMLRVRLTESERAELQNAAENTGMTLSEYARRKIFS